MSRTIKNRDLPHPKPVQRIELSEKHPKWRLALSVILLLIGAVALANAFMELLSPDSGWREIEANTASGLNCSADFVFLYNLGASGISASAENKAITVIYTEATKKAYQIFNNDQSFDGVTNVYDINQHPNEVLSVDSALYQAFELLQSYDSRYLYLAPVYAEYDPLFYCNDDSETANYDPYQNETVADGFAKIAAYANDPESVDLRLLGDNQIQLYVSEEYLAYADEQEITDFIDFYWMKNAFIVDYLAEVLTANHYTLGTLSSYDGFVRNLDESAAEFAFNLYDRADHAVYQAAVMRYGGPRSIVYLRDYKMNSLDYQHYYEMADGQVRTAYLDTRDGFAKNAVNNLVSYAKDAGCADILLRIAPIYIADAFDEEAVADLAKEDVYSIYCKDSGIYYNDSGLVLSDLYSDEAVCYTAHLIGEP